MNGQTEHRNAALHEDADHRSVDAARRRVLVGGLRLTVRLNDAIRLGHEFTANSEVVALIALRTSGPLRARELTARTGMTRAGTTNMIDRLERADMVRRGSVDDDLRGVVVELTESGVGKVDEMANRITAVFVDNVTEYAAWADDLATIGFDVGLLQLPTGGLLKRLDYLRRLSAAGGEIFPLYREAFGEDVGQPAVLLLALCLASEPGGTRPTEISQHALTRSASTSDLLTQAEQLGLVTRTKGSSGDRRAIIVETTERGCRAVDFIVRRCDPALRVIAETMFGSTS